MLSNDVRKKVQREATTAILKNKFQGIIDVSPRVGKSKLVIDALKKIKEEIPILIIAPFNNILESWKEEFIKWKFHHSDITLLNQRSLAKIDVNKFSLIISDECHTLSTYQRSLLKLYKGRLLGLSGSISADTKDTLRGSLGLVNIYKYSVAKAVDDKIIADYRIKIITLPLDASNKYIPAGSKAKPFKTTEAAHYKYLTRQFIQAAAVAKKDPSKDGWVKSILGKRARAIYGYQSKINLCKRLLKLIEITHLAEGGKTLVFTGLTANDICEYKYDSKQGEDNLTKFKSGKIKHLQVVEKVAMGQTIPDLKIGVFHQLKSNSEIMLQKALRMCNYEDGKPATIYILCYENTNDEKWVNKAVAMLDSTKIEYLHHKNI